MATNDKAFEFETIDRLIGVLNGGDDGAIITDEYRALIRKLGDPAYGDKRKGKLIIEISFAADAKGVNTSISCKVRDPVRPKFMERLFHSERGDTLTALDPCKGTMFGGADLGRNRMRAV